MGKPKMTIDFKNISTSTVTNITSLFEGRSGLKTIKTLNILNMDTQSVQVMSRLFLNCEQLKK